MFYVEDQDPILVKQEVRMDEEELKKLYQETTMRFGKYVHRSYDGAYGPYAFQKGLEELRIIKNYVETPTDETDSLGKDMMHYEYDEFVVPELADLIRRLLSGDVRAIDEIKKGPARGTKETMTDEEKQARKDLQEFLTNARADLDTEKFQRLTAKVLHYHQEEMEEELLDELKEAYRKVLSGMQFRPVITLYKDKWNELRRVYKDVKAFYEGTDEFEAQFAKAVKA